MRSWIQPLLIICVESDVDLDARVDFHFYQPVLSVSDMTFPIQVAESSALERRNTPIKIEYTLLNNTGTGVDEFGSKPLADPTNRTT